VSHLITRQEAIEVREAGAAASPRLLTDQ